VLGLLHSAFGFYLVDTISMHLLFLVATLFALLNAANLLAYFLGPSVALLSLVGWLPLLVALVRTAPDVLMYMHAYIHTYIYITQVRTAPDVLMVLAQRGRAKASYYLWGKLLTLSPFYYVFLLQSRAHHFAHTLRWGGGGYFATPRAIAIDHTPFHELFGTYARSHLHPA